MVTRMVMPVASINIVCAYATRRARARAGAGYGVGVGYGYGVGVGVGVGYGVPRLVGQHGRKCISTQSFFLSFFICFFLYITTLLRFRGLDV